MLGRNFWRSGSGPTWSIASNAPWVSIGQSLKARLAAPHISSTGVARMSGRPWPPNSVGPRMFPQPPCPDLSEASLKLGGVVTEPSFHFAPVRSPVAFSGESTSEANLPASSRIASTTSSVTSSHPSSLLTWSRPTTCLSTNFMSFNGATYSATALPLSPRAPLKRRWPGAQSDFCCQFGNDLEQVAHQPVVGDLEDRRFGILVDGDDHLAVLHP